MAISNKVIDEVVSEVAGEDVIPLVNLIKKKKNISEFKIAELMNVNVNIIRNMLYRLYHKNLVSFVRKKDKKKGWYIYYWTFNVKRIGTLLESIKKEKIEKLTERLEREKSSFFFSCPNNCIRLDFEKAMDYGFKCPECGSLMSQEDNAQKIKGIEGEIEKLGDKTKAKPANAPSPQKNRSVPAKKTEKPEKKKTIKKVLDKKKAKDKKAPKKK